MVDDDTSRAAARPGRAVLALFDIDGTLIRAGDPDHRAAFDHALTAVYGVPATLDGVPLGGMLDRQIARLALEGHDLDRSATEAGLDALVDAMAEHYVAAVARGDRVEHLLPGVARAAAALAEAGVALGVVTGTARRVARAKLHAAHLDDLFPVGAYGDEADERADLVALAIDRAAAHFARPFAPETRVVIGDTTLDVAAARGVGAKAVAVATGRVTRAALAATDPDGLIDDMSDAAATVTVVLAAVGER
jgi:phosphoglycolate phosphatase